MARRIETFSIEDTVSVFLELDNVKLIMDSQPVAGAGRLVVSDLDVAWWNAEQGFGYTLDYYSMMMHAVSRDSERYPQPCVACFLSESGSEETNEDDVDTTKEFLIIPPEDKLSEVYDAICEGQRANPDDDMDDGDDDAYVGEQPSIEPSASGWVFAPGFDPASMGLSGVQIGEDDDEEAIAAAVGGLNEVGQARLERLMGGLQPQNGAPIEEDEDQFADADE